MGLLMFQNLQGVPNFSIIGSRSDIPISVDVFFIPQMPDGLVFKKVGEAHRDEVPSVGENYPLKKFITCLLHQILLGD
jgi:hypothetical protein